LKLKIAVAAFAPLLLVGCGGVERGSSQAVQQGVALTETVARDPYALGTALTPQGAVPENATGETFLRGGEVFLSVDVSSASTDQVVEVKWIDPSGRVLRRDARRAPQGTDHVPFSSGATQRWRPGPHRAVVLIDGRSVSEKTFMVM
jgi:hypothetical protein